MHTEACSGARGGQLLVRTPVGTLQINSPLVGRQNVYNILAAVATGMATTVRGQPVPLKAHPTLPRGSGVKINC